MSEGNREKIISKLVQGSTGWIASADSKATSILGVAGVTLGLVLLDIEAVSNPILFGIYIAYVTSCVITIGFCISVLFPATDRVEMLKKPKPKGSKNVAKEYLGRSNIYFSEVANVNYQDFLDSLDKHDLNRDVEEQAYVLSYIANKKMKNVKLAIVSFAACLSLLCLICFFRVGLSFKDDLPKRSQIQTPVQKANSQTPSKVRTK